MKKNNIKKKLAYSIITLFLLCNISSLAYGTNESSKSHIMPLYLQDHVHVNDDYPEENETYFKTIQGGVNAVNSSETVGTVYVCSGSYNESVIIKKPMRIIGCPEDGYGNDPYPPSVSDPSVAFIILGNNAKGTTISHFNITGGAVAGILVLASRSINISYNNIFLNKKGIYLMSSHSCNITHNNVINNTHQGIVLDGSNQCNILGNWVVDNDANGLDDIDGSGIDLYDSNFAFISGNNMSNNGNYSIWVGGSKKLNQIHSNNIWDNETTFKSFKHRRWVDSKNEWRFNYWSDDKFEPGYFYRVRGFLVFGFGSVIPGFWFFQLDTASMKDPYPYEQNEI